MSAIASACQGARACVRACHAYDVFQCMDLVDEARRMKSQLLCNEDNLHIPFVLSGQTNKQTNSCTFTEARKRDVRVMHAVLQCMLASVHCR
jgi:hypothetical protein